MALLTHTCGDTSVPATLPFQAPAGAAQQAPDLGQWQGQDIPLVRPSSCLIKGGILSSQRYIATHLGPKRAASSGSDAGVGIGAPRP